jgi:hypothetical protein
MLKPDGRPRMMWDFFIVLPCLAYLGFMTPFFVCFAFDPRRTYNPGLLTFEAFIDVLFLLDIFLNFRTGFLHPHTGIVEMGSFKAALHYATTWCPVDLVSAIPFALYDLVSSGNSGALSGLGTLKVLKVGRTLKALRLFRFLKLSKLAKTASVFHLHMDRNTIDFLQDLMFQYGSTIQAKFVQVVLLLALLCHYFGCLWVMVGREGAKAGHENWLDTTFPDFNFRDTKHGDRVGSFYLASVYFCMTTMTR